MPLFFQLQGHCSTDTNGHGAGLRYIMPYLYSKTDLSWSNKAKAELDWTTHTNPSRLDLYLIHHYRWPSVPRHRKQQCWPTICTRFMYSETCDERPPHRKWLYITGGLSLEVQMYRNVGPCYCSSGLSSEYGLLSQVSVYLSVHMVMWTGNPRVTGLKMNQIWRRAHNAH